MDRVIVRSQAVYRERFRAYLRQKEGVRTGKAPTNAPAVLYCVHCVAINERRRFIVLYLMRSVILRIPSKRLIKIERPEDEGVVWIERSEVFLCRRFKLRYRGAVIRSLFVIPTKPSATYNRLSQLLLV